jgi:O-antigen/teichoic acid export membrane protein
VRLRCVRRSFDPAHMTLRHTPRKRRDPLEWPDSARSGGARIGGIFSPAAWLLTGAVVGRGSTLVASIVVARVLSPAQFGRLAILQTIVGLLAGVAGLGLSIALTRQIAAAAGREEAGRYVGGAHLATLIAGVAASIVYIASRSVVATQILQDPGTTGAVIASTGAVLFTALAANSQGALNGFEAFRSTALSQWGQGFGVGGGILLGARLAGLEGALAGLSIGTAVGAVVAGSLLAKELSERGIHIVWLPSRATWRSLWKPAAPAFIAFLVVSTALLVGQLVLSRQPHGYAEVGVFNLAYRWHLAVLFVPAVIAPALLPMLTRLIAQGDEGAARSLFRIYIAGTLILTIVPALAVILARHPILSFSGDYYANHPAPLVVLAVATIPSALNNVLSTGSLGIGAFRSWLVSDVALAVVLVGTAAVFVPIYAASGLALAYLLAYIATDTVLVYPVRSLFTGHRQVGRDH